MTGGPGGLSPQAQLGWRDQLSTNVPDARSLIGSRLENSGRLESPSDVSALAGLEEDDSNIGKAAAAAATNAGQYVSNIFKRPELDPMTYNLGLGQRQYGGRSRRYA